MPTYLVSVEESTVSTFRVRADNKVDAQREAVANRKVFEPVEQCDDISVTACVEEGGAPDA